MSFRSIIHDLRDGIGSLSRRGFEVKLSSLNKSKSQNYADKLNRHDHPYFESSSCWANLPSELLSDVMKRLGASDSTWPARKNVVACAAVCRSWREMCKQFVDSIESSGKITFPIALKQPGPRDTMIQCFIKRDTSNSTYYLYLCLGSALMVEMVNFFFMRNESGEVHVQSISFQWLQITYQDQTAVTLEKSDPIFSVQSS